MFTAKSQAEIAAEKGTTSTLLVSSPHPLSGLRLFRVTCADDKYGCFLEETSQKHHEFWLRNRERYANFNFDSDASFREYILRNSHEFSEYNRFVWKNNFCGLWIYVRSRLFKL